MSPYQLVRGVFLLAVGIAILACLQSALVYMFQGEVYMLQRYANGQSITHDETLWAGLSAIRRGTFDKW